MAMPEIPRYKGRFISPNGEPPGRKPPDIRSMARRHSRRVIAVLAEIATDTAQPGSTRVAAASVLLDRGWGKCPQPVTGEDGDGGIEIVIRHLVESNVRPTEKVIEHDDDGE